jgi:hypothetical protein
MPTRRSPWRFAAPVAALAALAVIALLLLVRTPQPPSDQTTANVQPTNTTAGTDAEDQQVIAAVSKSHPKRAESLKRDLSDVNEYISDAKKNVAQNPDDAEARDTLRQAYEQKALLYEVATSRSLE